MPVDIELYKNILKETSEKGARMVAVSKTKPASDILELYHAGQKDFGENYVQELAAKQQQMPPDIRWHFIGHLQSNKVKHIASFVHLIHSVDNIRLLKEIDKQAAKNNRIIDCLLQVYIATEETKYGLSEKELEEIIADITKNPGDYQHICIRGVMGMASFTADTTLIRKEMKYLKELYSRYAGIHTPGCRFSVLSMGMSADYKIAIEEGSNLVRIGSLLFGKREYAV